MSRVYPIEFKVVPAVTSCGQEIEKPLFEFPAEAIRDLDGIVARYSLSAEKFIAMQNRGFWGTRVWPWAMICFEEEYHLAGHVAELRGVKANMPFAAYSHTGRGCPPTPAGEVRPVSTVFVRKKGILKAMAMKSPFLAPAWEALKDKAEDAYWLCISDSPPEDWARQAAERNVERFLSAAKRAAEPALITREMLSDSAATAWGLGMEFRESGSWDRAIECFRAVAEERPDLAGVWHTLGEAYLDADLPQDAAASFHKAFVLQPSWMYAIFNLGLSYGKSGRHDKAIKWMRRLLDIDPFSERGWWWLAKAYDITGETAEWVDALGHYLDLEPFDAERWFELGFALCCKGEIAEGATAFRRTVTIAPGHGSGWNNLGFCLALLGDHQEAVVACRKSLELNSKDDAAWDSLGYAYLRAGSYEKAIEACLKAIELRSEYPDAWHHLAMAYRMGNQPEKCRSALAYLESMSPDEAAKARAEISAFERELPEAVAPAGSASVTVGGGEPRDPAVAGNVGRAG